MTVRGRYAPSPTGHLHLGNARTALLAWLQVRVLGGQFVLRVEDLDPQRSRPEYEAEQLEDLRWLGLDWDEGPDVGGPHGSYRQSDRLDLYAQAAAKLHTFPCACSRREVREAALAPHGREPVYPGTCRDAPRRASTATTLRWHTPDVSVTFHDALYGDRQEHVREEVGEFVLQRSDGVWAYQLAVVVDDEAMGITRVLRGADLLDSTARQILMQRTLGFRTPHYAHVPLVVGEDGEKLGKRHGAPNLATLRHSGVAPERVVAVLAVSAGLVDPATTSIDVQQLVSGFSLDRVPRVPTVVDYASLLAEV